MRRLPTAARVPPAIRVPRHTHKAAQNRCRDHMLFDPVTQCGEPICWRAPGQSDVSADSVATVDELCCPSLALMLSWCRVGVHRTITSTLKELLGTVVKSA